MNTQLRQTCRRSESSQKLQLRQPPCLSTLASGLPQQLPGWFSLVIHNSCYSRAFWRSKSKGLCLNEQRELLWCWNPNDMRFALRNLYTLFPRTRKA